MKILMLSATFPYPPSRGGTQVRTFNLLKHLSQYHSVTLVTQYGDEVTESEVEGLRQWVDQLMVFPRPQGANSQKGVLGKVKRFGSFLAQGTPPSVLHSYSHDLQQWLDEQVRTGKYEAITCEHSVNEIYVRPEFQQHLHTVVNVHSSVYGSCHNQLETGISEHPVRDRLNLNLLRRYEQRYCSKFSSIVVTTQDDERQLRAFNPRSSIAVIPNGVDLVEFPYRTADPGGHSLIFVGAMDNLQNIDAVRFFGLKVLPELQTRYPDATFSIVGSKPAPEVLELAERPGITVTGRVPSMAEYLHQATVCVVSMRTGFGIKNKTLEAMAAGVPVVSSDRGLEGLEVDSPQRALRANTVEEYLSAICRLFEEPSLRASLSYQGRKFVEAHYTWDQMGQRYEAVMTQKQPEPLHLP